MQEEIYKFENINLKYMFKPSDSDRSHLLVIFTGFKLGPMTGYDFQGDAIKGYKGNILWIKDDFDGVCAYYLCKGMKFDIEMSVMSLIEKCLSDLYIGKTDCTLVGFSKGGTAALYYGVKYGFNNIVATVPRFNVGSYISKNRASVADYMMGSVNNGKINFLNNILSNVIRSDDFDSKNIYLFSSKADNQFVTEIEPNLFLFEKYENFNFILTDSSMVRQHNQVTRYNTPLILSILYALCEGIVPKYGVVNNGGSCKELPRNRQSSSKKVVAFLNKARFEGEVFFPEGEAFIAREDCPDYGFQKKTLSLKSDKRLYQYPIGSVKNKTITYNNYNGGFYNYDAGGFATNRHKGISLSGIDCGKYDLSVNVASKYFEGHQPLVTKKELSIMHCFGKHLYMLYTENKKMQLIKRELVAREPLGAKFEVVKEWRKDNFYHVEGVFAISGIELSNWREADYFLVIKGASVVQSYILGMCNRDYISNTFGDGYSDYKKAYFSTLAGKGVDVSGLANGDYEVFVTMAYKKSLFTKKLKSSLSIT